VQNIAFFFTSMRANNTHKQTLYLLRASLLVLRSYTVEAKRISISFCRQQAKD